MCDQCTKVVWPDLEAKPEGGVPGRGIIGTGEGVRGGSKRLGLLNLPQRESGSDRENSWGRDA